LSSGTKAFVAEGRGWRVPRGVVENACKYAYYPFHGASSVTVDPI